MRLSLSALLCPSRCLLQIRWLSTNRLLGNRLVASSAAASASPASPPLELQIDGVKTGITPGAMACLALHAATAAAGAGAVGGVGGGGLRVISVTLGSPNATMRFIDNQRVLQWGVDALGAALASQQQPYAGASE